MNWPWPFQWILRDNRFCSKWLQSGSFQVSRLQGVVSQKDMPRWRQTTRPLVAGSVTAFLRPHSENWNLGSSGKDESPISNWFSLMEKWIKMDKNGRIVQATRTTAFPINYMTWVLLWFPGSGIQVLGSPVSFWMSLSQNATKWNPTTQDREIIRNSECIAWMSQSQY